MHDRHTRSTGMSARQRREHDRGILSRQTCTETKKKPENWGVTERKRKIKEVKHIIEEEAVEE